MKKLTTNIKIKLFLLSFMLFGYPLIAVFADQLGSSRQLTSPYRVIVLVIGLLLIVIGLFRRRSVLKPSLLQIFKDFPLIIVANILFFFAYSFRLFYDLGEGRLQQFSAEEYLFFWFGMSVVPGISFLTLRKSDCGIFLKQIFLFLSVIILLVFFYVGIGISAVSLTSGSLGGRAGINTLNPISLGHIGGSLVIVCVYCLLAGKSTIKILGIQKPVFIAMLFLALSILLRSASRGPIIATSLALGVYLIPVFAKGLKKNLFVTLMLLSFFALVIYAGIQYSADSIEILNQRLDATSVEISETEHRAFLYVKTLAYISSNPLLGFSIALPFYGYPHNVILEAFLSTGIFGGLLFTFSFVSVFWQSMKLSWEKTQSSGWLGILYVQYFVGAMFSGSIFGSFQIWYLFFAILALQSSDKFLSKTYRKEPQFVYNALI